MADTTDELLADEEIAAGLKRKRLSGKTILAAVAVLVVLVAGLVFFLSGGEEKAHTEPGIDPVLDSRAEEEAARQQAEASAEQVPEESKELLFLSLDPRVYNLNTEGEGASFLNISVTLEVDRQSYLADLEAKLPRILDEFNTYMRELRPSDLEGAGGIFRLKEELLRRINQTVAPTRVNDILFEEFLIQGTS